MSRLNISMTELHKRTGISRTVLLAYTRGTYAPGARELKLLCESLDITPTVLIYGTNQIATTPYRIGDIQLTKNGMDTIALLALVSQLTQAERKSILTLAEGISAARNPEAHRAVLASIVPVLESEELQNMMSSFFTQTAVEGAIADITKKMEPSDE